MIRLLSQNLESEVKTAILDTLGIVMDKGGIGVKPLVSQLQTTFVRQLQSTNTAVRTRAATLLGKLMPLSLRVDPLAKELVNSTSSMSGGIQTSMAEALLNVLKSAGKKIKKLADLLDLIRGMFYKTWITRW